MSNIHESTIPEALRCRTCAGHGEVVPPCSHGQHACECDDSRTMECEDCDGSGRSRCDMCLSSRSVVIAKNGHHVDRLCLSCHSEWMAESARNRAESRLTKQLEERR